MKQILVHLDGSRCSGERLALARRIGSEQGAVVAALYAVMPTLAVMPYSPVAGAGVATVVQEIDQNRRATAHAAFDSAMREPGCSVTWAEHIEAPIIRDFAQQALFADLLVLGQHDSADQAAPDVPQDFVESVIAASGKPAIVLPYTGYGGGPLKTVVIAWKETREAALAVEAALPLLRRASRVHVLEWAAEEQSAIKGERLDLDGYLHLHGVTAQRHRDFGQRSEMGEFLLSRCADLSADLLVMGCYGHSRAREWVLGGTSRTVLRSMTLPVLMAH